MVCYGITSSGLLWNYLKWFAMELIHSNLVFTGHILAFSADLQSRTESDSSPLPLPWIPSSTNSEHHIETIYSSDSQGTLITSKSFVCEVVFLQMKLMLLSFGILRRG